MILKIMRYKIPVLMALTLAFGTISISAQPIQEEFNEKIDEIFKDYNKKDVPGCAVSVFQNGHSVFQHGYGISNLDYGIEISDSTRFYMASVSKHVTAAAAGLLVIRGELDEEAPVSRYIEDWPDWASGVTLAHLFNHTSGLPDIYGLMSIGGMDINDVMDLEDYLEVVKSGEELMFDPGTDYSYTNSGYTTLAYLVEQTTGMRFPEFVEQEFFKPFGMKSTHFHNDRSRIIPNRAISYQPDEEQYRRTYPGNFQGVGPGGLYSTLQDWERWEQFWYGSLEWDGGISRDEATRLKGWILEPSFADGEEIDYRKGLRAELRKGTEMVSHGGSFRGFKTHYMRYPEQGFSFVTLCNRGDANPEEFNKDLSDLFLANTFEEYLNPYRGIYINDELPAEYELVVEDGNLILKRNRSSDSTLEEEDLDEWSAGSMDFEFQRDGQGELNGVKVSTSRAKDLEFRKKE